jgi:putative flippase GtrA
MDSRVAATASRPVGLVLGLLKDQRVRYLLVGATATLVYYGIFAGLWLVSSGHVPYLAVAVIANLCTAVLTYPLYRVVVFRTVGPWFSSLVKFYVASLWGLLFVFFGLPLLVELANVPVLVAQAIMLLCIPLINYQLNKTWAFSRKAAQ